jgi:hypothetical protein
LVFPLLGRYALRWGGALTAAVLAGLFLHSHQGNTTPGPTSTSPSIAANNPSPGQDLHGPGTIAKSTSPIKPDTRKIAVVPVPKEKPVLPLLPKTEIALNAPHSGSAERVKQVVSAGRPGPIKPNRGDNRHQPRVAPIPLEGVPSRAMVADNESDKRHMVMPHSEQPDDNFTGQDIHPTDDVKTTVAQADPQPKEQPASGRIITAHLPPETSSAMLTNAEFQSQRQAEMLHYDPDVVKSINRREVTVSFINVKYR